MIRLMWFEEFRRLVEMYPEDPQRVVIELLAYGDLKETELNEAWAERLASYGFNMEESK